MSTRFEGSGITRAALCVGLVHFALAPAALAQPESSGPTGRGTADAPWRRVLTGEDAKRVAELEAKLEKLESAGSFPEALAIVREVLAIRTRVQGEHHWQTADARWHLAT